MAGDVDRGYLVAAQPPSPGQRPRVICHMMASIDGRIVPGGWPELGEGWGEYETTGATFQADAWMCGRITMEAFAAGVRDESDVARDAAGVAPGDVARPDFVAPGAQPAYAVAVDPGGRLLWESSEINGDHLIALLGEGVSDAYLAGLRQCGISYLLLPARAGSGGIDLAAGLEKLAASFGVGTLLLEGGGGINGSMLRDGLIDEVSLLVVPVADGTVGAPSLIDVDEPDPEQRARRLVLQSVERRAADVLWLRYRVES